MYAMLIRTKPQLYCEVDDEDLAEVLLHTARSDNDMLICDAHSAGYPLILYRYIHSLVRNLVFAEEPAEDGVYTPAIQEAIHNAATTYRASPEKYYRKVAIYRPEPLLACDLCNDSGLMECGDCDGDSNSTCMDCNGDGFTDCTDCNGDWNPECGPCEGSGYIPCPDCHGSEEGCDNCYEGRVECYECQGDGTLHCQYCDEGRIWCEACDRNGTIHCEMCNGEGTVDCECGDE